MKKQTMHMNKIHVFHYQKDVEDHAFISSLLNTDTAISVHPISALTRLSEPRNYEVHCLLYECDCLTSDCLIEIQHCHKLNIPLLLLVQKLSDDINPATLHDVLLYKPEHHLETASFTGQLFVHIRCMQTIRILSDESSPIQANSHELIAIGASAGGPRALRTILRKIPEWMCGIVIVQHMIDANIASFATYLDETCKVHVKVAEQDEMVKHGMVYIAKQKQHLTVKKAFDGLYLHYEDGEKVNCVCPSIDVLFRSLTKLHNPRISGVLLTGMGADGAKGLKAMKDAGLFTIIQDKETCELYGMPSEAKRIHAYHRELPLDQISDYLIHHYANLHQKKERTS